jgi:hypothetical protein
MTGIGRAYGLFDCRSGREEIEAEFAPIRRCVRTPDGLGISFVGGVGNQEIDERIMDIVRGAKESGIRYVTEATCPGETNRRTADEEASMFNQLYLSPHFMEGEPFRGGIVFEERGEYASRE